MITDNDLTPLCGRILPCNIFTQPCRGRKKNFQRIGMWTIIVSLATLSGTVAMHQTDDSRVSLSSGHLS